MTMTNSMAFISQFGEYNPGGGKDEVLKYLNEAQKQVILAEKALKAILDCVESSAQRLEDDETILSHVSGEVQGKDKRLGGHVQKDEIEYNMVIVHFF